MMQYWELAEMELEIRDLGAAIDDAAFYRDRVPARIVERYEELNDLMESYERWARGE